jgi:pimeloyl-ACP methyl ester carboxylesterase
MASFEPITGRYIHLTVQGIEYRIYYEESGQGIPIICQHAGGSQTLEWRFMLNDPEIISKYRVVSADLPYHGKSLPPESEQWWKQEYKLTKSFFIDFQIELSRALGLERPIYLGQNSAGFLALDLALQKPDDFRAVIGVNTAIKAGTATLEKYYHPYIGNDYKRATALYFCAPFSPEKLRRADSWCAMLCAPPVTKGDLNYYFKEHDLTGQTGKIDTKRCAVYLLTGEYDPTSSIEDTIALAKEIKGAKFTAMKGLSHCGMPENPPLFKTYLMPILDEISKQHSKQKRAIRR